MANLDYSHRPAKSVQRYMVIDACRRLIPFGPLSDYQYIGFGGLEFVDFDLAHRTLGIESMVSMEKNQMALERLEFNRPFRSIRIAMGESSSLLPSIVEWDRPAIIWMDYTARLRDYVIDDCALLVRQLAPGSMLVVTVNAKNPPALEDRRSSLVKMVGEERVPVGVTDESLAKWGLADTQWAILTGVIRAAVRDRIDGAQWRQVLNLNYADGAQMQTLAGVIVGSDRDAQWTACRFDELPYFRDGQKAVEIRVPVLTAKERRALDEQMPLSAGHVLALAGVKEADVSAYQAVYRYAHLMNLPV